MIRSSTSVSISSLYSSGTNKYLFSSIKTIQFWGHMFLMDMIQEDINMELTWWYSPHAALWKISDGYQHILQSHWKCLNQQVSLKFHKHRSFTLTLKNSLVFLVGTQKNLSVIIVSYFLGISSFFRTQRWDYIFSVIPPRSKYPPLQFKLP